MFQDDSDSSSPGTLDSLPVTVSQTAPGPGTLSLPDQTLPPNLFVLPFNHAIPFPTLLAPIQVVLPKHVEMVEEAISRQRVIGILLTKESEMSDSLRSSDLYSVGVAVRILKRIKLPDGSVNLLVHSTKRFVAERVLSEHPYLVVEARYIDDEVEKSNEMDALARTVVAQVKKLSEVNPFFTEEMRLAMINAPNVGVVADLVAFSLALPKSDAQGFLETFNVRQRFEKLLVHLRREQEVADLQKKITDDVDLSVSKMQREFFLKEQLKLIKRELGYEEDGKQKSARSLRDRIEGAGLPEESKKTALEELDKFETLSESSPEYNVSRNWLETVASLPWSTSSVDQIDLAAARKVLDTDHAGLEKVKERILEFLAVRKLNPNPRGSIICLVGPPGVGKTSIGKSIAKTLGRSFFRFSLGGMRDEAEIKGHRRTYVGALPGKVLNGMKRAGTKNPVLLLDEIDKLGQSYQGDPASALLEVLDPEQNATFLDHYLDLPFDLSKVLFIVTANTTSTIPAPLLDRMEVIELTGYTIEEKEDIVTRYILPRELEASGVTPKQLRVDKAALRKIINEYGREPGLRSMQQLMNRLARRAAAKIVVHREKNGEKSPIVERVTVDQVQEWLGPPRFYNEVSERVTAPGVVTGLAWTSLGGDILFIEATDVPGTGNLKLTGQMGGVMTESAQIAWTFVKKRILAEKARTFEQLKHQDFHLHIPAGAIPKDGPSAGVTMASALYSLATGRRARQRVAMTGELSLIGKVLPVGGIKEKILAARRAGIDTIILPKQNQKDLLEIPRYVTQGMTLHFVSNVDEVFALVLEPKAGAKAEKIIRGRRRVKASRTVLRAGARSGKRGGPGARV